MSKLVDVVRGDLIESEHVGHLSLMAPDGAEVLSLGDVARNIFPRSTIKPVQALACLTAGAQVTDEQLAIGIGSHTGTDRHVAVVLGLLGQVGLDSNALRCTPDLPEDVPTRTRLACAGHGPTPLRMNCSGKHALMLVTCRANGWPVEGYLDPAHPLQAHIRRTIGRLTRDAIAHASVDGCGAPLFSVTTSGLARAFRMLVTAETGTPERRIADVMRAHPFLIGGQPHANSDAMRRMPGLIAKGGAEGVIAMASADGAAVAVKVSDGNPRATTFIALRALSAVGLDIADAGDLAEVPVLGGGQPVGRFELASDLSFALRGIERH